MLFVGEALEGEVVGLRQVTDDAWSMHLGPLALATLHGRSHVLIPTAPDEVSLMCPGSRAEDVGDQHDDASVEAALLWRRVLATEMPLVASLLGAYRHPARGWRWVAFR